MNFNQHSDALLVSTNNQGSFTQDYSGSSNNEEDNNGFSDNEMITAVLVTIAMKTRTVVLVTMKKIVLILVILVKNTIPWTVAFIPGKRLQFYTANT